MNKFKDWFYNYSDIFAGILITGIAAIIIVSSVSNIMSFSDSIHAVTEDKPEASSAVIHSSSQSGDIDVLASDDEGLSGSGIVGTPSGIASSGGAINASTPPAVASNTTPAITTPAASGTAGSSDQSNAMRKRITINVANGSTASKIAQSLKDAGLITETNDFLSVLASSGLDSKLRSGSFSIPEGSNVTEIIKILTGK